MSDHDFSQRVLDKIEHEHVRPVPRWAVLLQRVMAWGITVTSILFAALFCSLLVIAIQHIDYDVMRAAHPGSALFFLGQYIPVLWIVFFVAFCVLVIFLLRRETHAYRYRRFAVAGLVGVGVILIGLFLELLQVSDQAEQYVERGFPSVARPWMMRGRVLPRPEDGILVGRVIDLTQGGLRLERPSGSEIAIEDRRLPMEVWEVRFSTGTVQVLRLHLNQEVIARGAVIQQGLFQAEWIRPHQPPRPRQMRLER